MVKEFCTALSLFKKISEMTSILIIDKYENVSKFVSVFNYTQDTQREMIASSFIHTFREKVKLFYDYGRDNFLSETSVGDQETFYLHIMRWEFLRMLEKYYKKHKIGLGVFSMEGFEAKNSKSKTAIRQRSNCKGNVCQQSTLYLLRSFVHHRHDISDILHAPSLPSYHHDFCIIAHKNKKAGKISDENCSSFTTETDGFSFDADGLEKAENENHTILTF